MANETVTSVVDSEVASGSKFDSKSGSKSEARSEAGVANDNGYEEMCIRDRYMCWGKNVLGT